MSSYERYDETSRHYDGTRVPVGVEIILGCLARLGRPPGELALLDAGCGTGAYARAVVDRVGRIEALDMSEGMLAKARAKLADAAAAGRVRFHRGSVTALPFADGALDAVMVNQVLHHLDDDPDAGYPALGRAIDEFARVLAPGGGLVINTCSHEQLDAGFWFLSLIPKARDKVRRRLAPLEAVRARIAEAGLEYRGAFVPVDAVCQGPAYFDGRGPLDKAWRDGDSTWALADPDELEAALARVGALDEAGELDAYVAAHDARRPHVGQFTFVFATRR